MQRLYLLLRLTQRIDAMKRIFELVCALFVALLVVIISPVCVIKVIDLYFNKKASMKLSRLFC